MSGPAANPHRRSFRAMGCRCQIVIRGEGDDAQPSRVAGDPLATAAISAAVATIERLEARWSRFRDDSDISRINRADGRAVVVEPGTIDLLAAMATGTMVTGGAFDPTVLHPIVGLDHQPWWWAEASHCGLPTTGHMEPPAWPDAVEVDLATSRVRVPSGMALDAGGIGKGLAADKVVAQLLGDNHVVGAAVSIGGDVRVGGTGPAGRWAIGIDGPDDHRIEHLTLSDAGVATSGTRRSAPMSLAVASRRPDHQLIADANDAVTSHHLVDPRTGRSATCRLGDRRLVQATVVAATAATAEVLTKAVLFAASAERVAAIVDHARATALVVDDRGTVERFGPTADAA